MTASPPKDDAGHLYRVLILNRTKYGSFKMRGKSNKPYKNMIPLGRQWL